jgi:glycosyltransferase involved in cell wall biosynthesis
MIEVIIITFNRVLSLRRTLEAIKVSSLASLKITVLDNCSTDGTSEFLEDIARERTLNLFNIRNSVNIGACANVMRAYEIATEEYIWLLCDDDNYNFSTFSDVVNAIDVYKPDLILVGSHKNETSEHMFPGKLGFPIEANNLSNTDFLLLLTFLPSSIIKTKKIKSCDFQVGYLLASTYFPQFFWISKVENENWIIFIMPSFLVTRPLTGHGLDSDFTHANGFLLGCEQFNSPARIEHMRNIYFGYGLLKYTMCIAKTIVNGRICRNINLRQYSEHLMLLDPMRKLVLVTMLPIFIIPVSLLKKIKDVYLKIK